jgi:hypothetical protein
VSGTSSRPRTLAALLVLAASLVLVLHQSAGPAGAAAEPAAAGGWVVNKSVTGKPACASRGFAASYFDSLDCGFGSVKISGAAPTSVVRIEFVAEDGTSLASAPATFSATTAAWSFTF